MTTTAIKLTTRVLPGKRIEFTAPELVEGANVELIVLQLEEITPPKTEDTMGVWDWLHSLPPSTLTMKDWERMERERQEEKDAWER